MSLNCPVCDATGARWRLHANSNSFHGVIPAKPVGSGWLELWSLEECLEVCSVDPRCLAVDFDMDSRTCYVHRDLDFAQTRGPYPQVHQFVVSERCHPGYMLKFYWFDVYLLYSSFSRPIRNTLIWEDLVDFFGNFFGTC